MAERLYPVQHFRRGRADHVHDAAVPPDPEIPVHRAGLLHQPGDGGGGICGAAHTGLHQNVKHVHAVHSRILYLWGKRPADHPDHGVPGKQRGLRPVEEREQG